MADAKNAKKEGKAQKKGKGKLKFYTFLIIAMVASPFMFPTAVLLLVGLIPTIVAFVVDKDREHSSATAIGAMNCAGLTPFIIDLWMKGQTMGNAFQILSSANSWLIILGSAAIGQMIVSVVPQAMASLTLVHSEMRVKTLKQNLETLSKSWGTEVGSTKPIEKIVNME